jgi:hypothetical protein
MPVFKPRNGGRAWFSMPTSWSTTSRLRQPPPSCPSPTARSPSRPRPYYTVWVTQPYIRNAMVGSGLYGISAKAYAEIGDLPDVFGDDEWLRTRFSPERRRSVASTQAGDPLFFRVRPPSTVLSHIRIEARRMRAVAEIRQRFPSLQTTRNNQMSSLSDARADGAGYLDIAIYLAMKAAARLLVRYQALRGTGLVWTRDRANAHDSGL